jgi:hypothetical protein
LRAITQNNPHIRLRPVIDIPSERCNHRRRNPIVCNCDVKFILADLLPEMNHVTTHDAGTISIIPPASQTGHRRGCASNHDHRQDHSPGDLMRRVERVGQGTAQSDDRTRRSPDAVNFVMKTSRDPEVPSWGGW